MILPVVETQASLDSNYLVFIEKLKQAGFSGEIETDYGHRLSMATDNSIYQQLPQAVVFPSDIDDLCLVGKLAATYPDIRFGPRGGGTGTNGQSLTPGIVVDLSKHMNKLLEINPQEGWVRVQAGMVKDQLNDYLRPHGYFFAPDLSTSNRATIGGMINTDASGQGSLVYGKTSDHLLGLKAVMANGDILETQSMPIEDAETLAGESHRLGQVCKQLLASCRDKREAILAKFPRLNRFLTGYDLEHAVSDDLSSVDIGRLIAGSEGTLAFVAEAKLNVTPIPKNKVLLNIQYDSFESALRHAPIMVAANATSVETVDSKVLNLAREDIIWHSVSPLIQDIPGETMLGLNMVEYNDDDLDDINSKISALEATLTAEDARDRFGVIGYQLTRDPAEIQKVYAMRKKAVGLLGNTKGRAKPIAFAEDTAVPPENLADFILEFRDLLDSKGLQYGMFGHVDAGVLHVRPALDMCDPHQEVLMKELSDQVVALVAKYGGLMWGEHGKGYRSEYAPEFFGDELFAELRKIKTAFDPHNQLNPGKICTPYESTDSLVSVSDTKRGAYDRQIPVSVRDDFPQPLSCNGNGLCFNYDTKSPMCPSSKITKDRRHSPKGRAGLMREWLRLLNKQGVDVKALENAPEQSIWQRIRNTWLQSNQEDFSHQVFDAMNGCLACKACTSQCPVSVDVPTFRARFLSLYYSRYQRPLKDYLVANVEQMAPLLAKMPGLANFASANPLSAAVLKWLGYVDTPQLSSPNLSARWQARELPVFDENKIGSLSDAERAKHVLIVQDPFTSFYEADLVTAYAQLLVKLGYTPLLLPFSPNGKPQHVKGFLKRFELTALRTAEKLRKAAKWDIPMVGMDASLVLCYRDEYGKALGDKRGDFEVLLVHEWFKLELDSGRLKAPTLAQTPNFALFAHCTEKTRLPASEQHWQEIFAAFGATLTPVSVGCCGMAGTYGHEAEHLDNSKGIFDLSWSQSLKEQGNSQLLATGYSCRSQVKRLTDSQVPHPVQALNAAIN